MSTNNYSKVGSASKIKLLAEPDVNEIIQQEMETISCQDAQHILVANFSYYLEQMVSNEIFDELLDIAITDKSGDQKNALLTFYAQARWRTNEQNEIKIIESNDYVCKINGAYELNKKRLMEEWPEVSEWVVNAMTEFIGRINFYKAVKKIKSNKEIKKSKI